MVDIKLKGQRMNDKVNILGTEYKIRRMTEEEDVRLKNCNGYTDFTIKEIVISKIEPDEDSFQDLEYYAKRCLRHEITHAALFESGIDHSSHFEGAWARNEEMVDWIAIQSPKLIKMFEEADAL